VRFRREGDEAPMPGGFSRLGARRRTRQYVEHPKARKHAWRGCIVSRSRQLVKSPGQLVGRWITRFEAGFRPTGILLAVCRVLAVKGPLPRGALEAGLIEDQRGVTFDDNPHLHPAGSAGPPRELGVFPAQRTGGA
jgi:hypothetical protein